jgi:hypothetical protein
MFKEYETFKLAKQIPCETIQIGTVGVVLMVYPRENSGDNHAYEVEFCDACGMNLGSQPTYTLTEDYLGPAESKPG